MSHASTHLTGGCFCGTITYRVTGPLAPATRCHCSLCRKRFGGAGSAMSMVKGFAWTAGEAQLTRYGEAWGLGFCSLCGSTLVGIKGDTVLGITLSSLDGDPPVTIQHHIFTDSRASWDHIPDDAPHFGEWPS